AGDRRPGRVAFAPGQLGELRADDPLEIARHDAELEEPRQAGARGRIVADAERALSAVPERLRVVRLLREHLLDQVAYGPRDRRLILEHVGLGQRQLEVVVGIQHTAPGFLERLARTGIVAERYVAAPEQAPALDIVRILGHQRRELRDQRGLLGALREQLGLPRAHA